MRKVRVIDADSVSEVELVARRMRQTLMEVLGEHVGRQLYTMTGFARGSGGISLGTSVGDRSFWPRKMGLSRDTHRQGRCRRRGAG